MRAPVHYMYLLQLKFWLSDTQSTNASLLLERTISMLKRWIKVTVGIIQILLMVSSYVYIQQYLM